MFLEFDPAKNYIIQKGYITTKFKHGKLVTMIQVDWDLNNNKPSFITRPFNINLGCIATIERERFNGGIRLFIHTIDNITIDSETFRIIYILTYCSNDNNVLDAFEKSWNFRFPDFNIQDIKICNDTPPELGEYWYPGQGDNSKG